MIHTNQILLCSNWPELSPWSFTHVFKKIETTMRWNCMSKALRFLQITAEHQDCPFFTVFLTTKSLSQNISITLLQISLKLHEHRGCYWRKKLPWVIFEEQFLVPRYTDASKIGNTTVVAIFPKLCFWQRSLCSNLAGIDPEKLYRATFICQYGLCCCFVWPSSLFDCFVKIWATCKNFWANGLPPPLAENCPYAYE